MTSNEKRIKELLELAKEKQSIESKEALAQELSELGYIFQIGKIDDKPF